MPTQQSIKFTLANSTSEVVMIWLAHRVDSLQPVNILMPPAPDGVLRIKYPNSNAYSYDFLEPDSSISFHLNYEAGNGAGMDYWYVAINIIQGNLFGAYSIPGKTEERFSGGTTLLPVIPFKIPDTDTDYFSAVILSDANNNVFFQFNSGGAVPHNSKYQLKKDTIFNPVPSVRKSVATLSPQELSAYVIAMKELKTKPSKLSPPTRSRYDDYVFVHMLTSIEVELIDSTKPVDNSNIDFENLNRREPTWAHGCPAFIPWHREFLYQFEQDYKQVRGDLLQGHGVPYWDWTINFATDQIPWTDNFMGGDGNDGPVTTGPFAGNNNWPITISQDRADTLVRGFGLSEVGRRLPNATEVGLTFTVDDYDSAPWSMSNSLVSFRNQLEGFYLPPYNPEPKVQIGIHNLVHVWIGGNKGSMLYMTSPNDPIFFLHHCNIDKIWVWWQIVHTSDLVPDNPPMVPFYLPDTSINGVPGQALNESMIFMDPKNSSTPPWSDPPATPGQIINHHTLNYLYDFEMPEQPRQLNS